MPSNSGLTSFRGMPYVDSDHLRCRVGNVNILDKKS
jgi:hypothetical protein